MKAPQSLKIRSAVRREDAPAYLLISLISFGSTVILTRWFLELTGYPQLGNSTLHIAHVLWGGLILFMASLLPLMLANQWAFTLSAVLSGVGVGLFIDEVGKFITTTNDYFYPPAAPIIYAFFLMVVMVYLIFRRPGKKDSRSEFYGVFDELTEVLDDDLNPREHADLDHRLRSIISQEPDSNLSRLADHLLAFLNEKEMVLAPDRPNIFTRLNRRIRKFEERFLTQKRLRILLVVSLVALGLVGMIQFQSILGLLPDRTRLLEQVLVTQFNPNAIRSARNALWYVIYLFLEGTFSLLLIFAGTMLTTRLERIGFSLAVAFLIIKLSVVNLLAFYYDQFGAVIATLVELAIFLLLLIYRRRMAARPVYPLPSLPEAEDRA